MLCLANPTAQIVDLEDSPDDADLHVYGEIGVGRCYSCLVLGRGGVFDLVKDLDQLITHLKKSPCPSRRDLLNRLKHPLMVNLEAVEDEIYVETLVKEQSVNY